MRIRCSLLSWSNRGVATGAHPAGLILPSRVSGPSQRPVAVACRARPCGPSACPCRAGEQPRSASATLRACNTLRSGHELSPVPPRAPSHPRHHCVRRASHASLRTSHAALWKSINPRLLFGSPRPATLAIRVELRAANTRPPHRPCGHPRWAKDHPQCLPVLLRLASNQAASTTDVYSRSIALWVGGWEVSDAPPPHQPTLALLTGACRRGSRSNRS